MTRLLPLLLVVGLASLPGLGCSAMQSWKQTAEAGDVAKIRQERRKDIVGDFERRRARAQLQAAQERAEQGDPESAEKILLDVIEQNATHVDARAQLAELYWAHEAWDDAELQLREALKLAPERADLHHSLGLVLDAAGNGPAAREHLAKAVELEPSNKLYLLAAESAGPLSPGSQAGSYASVPGQVQPAQSLLPYPPATNRNPALIRR